MEYNLQGIVDRVEDKQIVIGGHLPTIEKVKKIGPNPPLIRGNKIYIKCKGHTIEPDIEGHSVTIRAKIRHYSFKQKKGWNLYLISCKKLIVTQYHTHSDLSTMDPPVISTASYNHS